MTFRILDVDWCTSDKVILASDDGCIRILEMSMKSTCFRMDEQELTGTGPDGRLWNLLCARCSLLGRVFCPLSPGPRGLT